MFQGELANYHDALSTHPSFFCSNASFSEHTNGGLQGNASYWYYYQSEEFQKQNCDSFTIPEYGLFIPPGHLEPWREFVCNWIPTFHSFNLATRILPKDCEETKTLKSRMPFEVWFMVWQET
jgi:hypothetical protein